MSGVKKIFCGCTGNQSEKQYKRASTKLWWYGKNLLELYAIGSNTGVFL